MTNAIYLLGLNLKISLRVLKIRELCQIFRFIRMTIAMFRITLNLILIKNLLESKEILEPMEYLLLIPFIPRLHLLLKGLFLTKSTSGNQIKRLDLFPVWAKRIPNYLLASLKTTHKTITNLERFLRACLVWWALYSKMTNKAKWISLLNTWWPH